MGNQPCTGKGRLTLSMPLHVIARMQRRLTLLKHHPESTHQFPAPAEAPALVESRVAVVVMTVEEIAAEVVIVLVVVVVVLIQYPQELIPPIRLQQR